MSEYACQKLLDDGTWSDICCNVPWLRAEVERLTRENEHLKRVDIAMLTAANAALSEEVEKLSITRNTNDIIIGSYKYKCIALSAEVERLRNGGWIAVGERLPEDRDEVLIYSMGDGYVMTGRHAKQVPQWEAERGYYYHGVTYSWITHWMPLPAPPTDTGTETVCRWTPADTQEASWFDTGCGEAWMSEDGGPYDNNYKWCPFCGRTIEVVVTEEEVEG